MKSHGKGKYGRVLGELFIKKENEYISVNETLVKEGFAKEYFGGKR
jgi:endonuclease YncB( thermonuclease family)